MFEDLNPVILFRMTERLFLTGMVIIVSLVVLVGFWKTVQRVTLKDGGPLGIAGSVALSTPVFALMSIILYAWVSLSHPISYTGPVTETEGSRIVTSDAGTKDASEFVGAVNPRPQIESNPSVSAHARQLARTRIWTLNCLAALSNVGPAMEADIIEIKLTLMGSVWQDDWGNLPQFESWARNPAATVTPSPEAVAFYEGRHIGC